MVIDAHAHCGIKWHRHSDEPPYHYQTPACRAALAEIRRRRLPVVLEEEFGHTVRFIRELAQGITVIIPHLGMLNGGFARIMSEGLWDLDHVWADTALAAAGDIRTYLERRGHHRLLFGSDFPFGHPAAELAKVQRLGLAPEAASAVLGGNFRRLQAQVFRDASR
jgi:predicted TIM-barrel fold metal-dependent hydrolase